MAWNPFAGWRKSEAASDGRIVATIAVEEAAGTDPTPAPGNRVVDVQRMHRVRSDGVTLDAATTATALAPLTTIGSVAWSEAIDLAALRGVELQNVNDVSLLLVYATAQPANGADLGVEMKPGALRFFAPAYEAGYRGKVWVRAVSGTNKTLRRNAW